ncbi:MAG: hypothetical protein IPH12_13740 [Saprospirales bacterium]|nr:hypothetical protein [Saprospirales bacterium]
MKPSLLLLLIWPLSLNAQILFPGDANNDGRADHLDVLATGLSFSQEGPFREPPFLGVDWSPKLFEPWLGALPATGINFGFSDADGNGMVNEKDMAAIKMNYDSTQTGAQPPPKPYAPPDTFLTTALPRLVFRFEQDTATVRDTLRLHIFYEHPPGLPLHLSPLGVAFTLQFDEMLVKDSLTQIIFEPGANDLLFAAGATGFADARVVPPGRVEFGAAGKAIPGLAFSRPLGVVQFIVEDVIVRADTFWTKFKIEIAKPLMINMQEEVMTFGIAVDDVVLFQELSNTAAPDPPFSVRMYPSPVGDVLHVEFPDAVPGQIRIFNSASKMVLQREISDEKLLRLPANYWPPGWYWVCISARNGRTVSRAVLKL